MRVISLFFRKINIVFVLCLCFSLCSSNFSFAQKGKKNPIDEEDFRYLEISFIIKKDKIPLKGARAEISKNSARYQAYTTGRNGKVTLQLAVNAEYMVTISAERCITKRISISTQGISDKEDKETVWVYDDIEVELFETEHGVAGAEILEKAYARVAYNNTFGDFDFDQDYAKAIKKELAKLSAEAKKKLVEEAEAKAKQHAKEAGVKAKEEAMNLLHSETDTKAKTDAERVKKEKEENAKIETELKEKVSSTIQMLQDAQRKTKAEEQVKAEITAKKEKEENAKLEVELKAKVATTFQLFREAQKHFKDSVANLEKNKSEIIAKANATDEPSVTQQAELKSETIAITQLQIFFKEIAIATNAKLPYDQNNLTFKFTGVSLTKNEEVSYQYMLKGFDKEWLPATTVNSVTYSNLPPSEYTFLVKACNKDGMCNNQPASFSFTITPPFWNTIWFYVLCLIMATIFIIIRNKTKEEKTPKGQDNKA